MSEFFITYANSISTLIVGSVALIVYQLSKRAERRSAALIIIMDIRHAELIVQSILEKGIDMSTKDVMMQNNWGKYKHLFAKDLSQDQFSRFNDFFLSCAEASDARSRVREIFYTTLNEKARILQNRIYDTTPVDQQKVNAIVADINNGFALFDPDEPRLRMLKNLQNMGSISGTTAYDKLKRIAGEK